MDVTIRRDAELAYWHGVAVGLRKILHDMPTAKVIDRVDHEELLARIEAEIERYEASRLSQTAHVCRQDDIG